MAQLHNVEVYNAEKVIIEWQLSLQNDQGIGKTNVNIIGRTDSGRVKLTQEGNVL